MWKLHGPKIVEIDSEYAGEDVGENYGEKKVSKRWDNGEKDGETTVHNKKWWDSKQPGENTMKKTMKKLVIQREKDSETGWQENR